MINTSKRVVLSVPLCGTTSLGWTRNPPYATTAKKEITTKGLQHIKHGTSSKVPPLLRLSANSEAGELACNLVGTAKYAQEEAIHV